jgi:hypothetical protein
MKLVKGGIAFAIAAMMIACGGNTKKEKENDIISAPADSTATPDSLKLVAGSYLNEELGYSITYPKDILTPQVDTKKTNEQIFLPKEGKAKLRIYKDERKDRSGKILSFNEIFDIDRGSSSKRQISYSSLNPLFYAISGVEGSEIFYQKTIISKGTMVTAKLTYTKEEKPTYDAMIAPLFNSFK